jgi:hypothetical protein
MLNRSEMRIKTQAGILIAINSDGSSKTIFFNKPVRAIELTKDEVLQVSTALITGVKTGITTELRKLIIEEFFTKPRSFRNIREGLTERGIRVKSASLSTILNKMIERKELVRIGTKGSYLYHQPPQTKF